MYTYVRNVLHIGITIRTYVRTCLGQNVTMNVLAPFGSKTPIFGRIENGEFSDSTRESRTTSPSTSSSLSPACPAPCTRGTYRAHLKGTAVWLQAGEGGDIYVSFLRPTYIRTYAPTHVQTYTYMYVIGMRQQGIFSFTHWR